MTPTSASREVDPSQLEVDQRIRLPARAGFVDTVRYVFRNWNRTAERASRSEYWSWFLFYLLVLIGLPLALGLIAPAFGRGFQSAALLGWLALLLVLFVPTLTVSVRRLHDTDRSGLWLLLNFVPYLGTIVLVVIYCLDGSSGRNRYGDRPGGNLVASATSPQPVLGVADELRKLNELRVAGTITDVQFARQRARLLPD